MPDQTTDEKIAILQEQLDKLQSRKATEQKFEAIMQSSTDEELKVLYEMLKFRLFDGTSD